MLNSLSVDLHAYGSFLIVMAGMAASPGPANLFALATGLTRGPRAGLAGVLGMNLGSLVWFVAAAFGLGLVMKTVPQIFVILSSIGCMYLFWLGFKSIRRGLTAAQNGFHMSGRAAQGSPLWEGFIVQITNPKALLFFTAVLPPFIDIARPMVPQLAMFAAGTFFFDLVQMSLYALAGGVMSARFAEPRFARLFLLGTGTILCFTALLVTYRTFATP